MKILSIQGADVGGAAWRWENMLTKYGGHEVIRYQQASLRLGFPAGKETNQSEIIEHAKTADIVHVHTAQMTAAWSDVLRKSGINTPVCGTMHGIESLGARAKGVRDKRIPCVFVTPNLSHAFPHGIFIPNAVDPEEEGILGSQISLDSKDCEKFGVPSITCSKSYVARHKNHTERDQFSKGLLRKFPDDFVPNSLWLRDYVAVCDFVWDHLQGYWGQTAVEAFWLRTIPVVAPNDHNRSMAASFFDEEVPFGPRNLDDWKRFLQRYTDDPQFRSHEVARRYDFVVRKWHPSVIVRDWESFYSEKVLR